MPAAASIRWTKPHLSGSFGLSVLNRPHEIQVAKALGRRQRRQDRANRGTFSDIDSLSVIVSASLGTITQQNGHGRGATPRATTSQRPSRLQPRTTSRRQHRQLRLKVKNVGPSTADARFQLPENSPLAPPSDLSLPPIRVLTHSPIALPAAAARRPLPSIRHRRNYGCRSIAARFRSNAHPKAEGQRDRWRRRHGYGRCHH